MREELTQDEAAEERRLWADYYEATARALEIMRTTGTSGLALPAIVAEHAKAAAAIQRSQNLHGIKA